MTAVSLDRAPAKAQDRQWARTDLWLILGLSLFALAVRFPFLGDHNADIDEQLYALIGSQLWHGQLPFVDLWDRKPFGLFLLFGLADASGLPAPWSYQLFATIFIVLGALLLRRLALLLVDTTTAGVLARDGKQRSPLHKQNVSCWSKLLQHWAYRWNRWRTLPVN